MAAQKKNKLTEADLIKKKASTKQAIGGVRTNKSVTKYKKEYYQKFVNLAVNETPLPQGDGIIRISPFDDYFLFTIFDTIEGEDTPIDLSNVGDIYINFIGTTDEIDIKNHTQVAEADLSKGEVLFRITRSDSKKILALDNSNFYISTKMVSIGDESISDESILYQGIWLAFDEASRVTLLSQIEEQREAYSKELGILKEENARLNEVIKQLTVNVSEQDVTIVSLQRSNEEMSNEIAELTGNLESAALAALQIRAKDVQLLADTQIRKTQQIRAIKEIPVLAQTSASNPGFWRNAAKNLQNYTIGNVKFAGGGIGGGGDLNGFNNIL
jgi:hypothetical protein